MAGWATTRLCFASSLIIVLVLMGLYVLKYSPRFYCITSTTVVYFVSVTWAERISGVIATMT